MREKSTKVARVCERCGQQFWSFPSTIQRGGGRFCSSACYLVTPQGPRKKRPLADRFWAKVTKTATCWLWTSTVSYRGYGLFWYLDGGASAHRIAWSLAAGELPPPGSVVGHICDTPLCVRNDEPGVYEVNGTTLPRFGHLFLGDPGANNADRDAKGRQATGDRTGGRLYPERFPRGEQQWKARLTAEQVRQIRREYVPRAVSLSTLARAYGVSRRTVGRIVNDTAWRHVT